MALGNGYDVGQEAAQILPVAIDLCCDDVKDAQLLCVDDDARSLGAKTADTARQAQLAGKGHRLDRRRKFQCDLHHGAKLLSWTSYLFVVRLYHTPERVQLFLQIIPFSSHWEDAPHPSFVLYYGWNKEMWVNQGRTGNGGTTSVPNSD
jgi:hypothetical protein